MKCLRILMIGLAVAGLTLATGDESAAQFGKFKKKRTMPFQPQNGAPKPGGTDAKPADPASGDVDLFAPTLLPAEFLARLKLTAEQKTETAKIQTEFADKLKQALANAKDEAAKNGGKGAPGGAGKGAPGGAGKGVRPGAGGGGRPGAGGSGTPGLNEAIGLRSDYEEKVYDLLNEGQQKIWLDIKAKKGEGLLNGGAAAGNKTPNKK